MAQTQGARGPGHRRWPWRTLHGGMSSHRDWGGCQQRGWGGEEASQRRGEKVQPPQAFRAARPTSRAGAGAGAGTNEAALTALCARLLLETGRKAEGLEPEAAGGICPPVLRGERRRGSGEHPAPDSVRRGGRSAGPPLSTARTRVGVEIAGRKLPPEPRPGQTRTTPPPAPSDLPLLRRHSEPGPRDGERPVPEVTLGLGPGLPEPRILRRGSHLPGHPRASRRRRHLAAFGGYTGRGSRADGVAQGKCPGWWPGTLGRLLCAGGHGRDPCVGDGRNGASLPASAGDQGTRVCGDPRREPRGCAGTEGSSPGQAPRRKRPYQQL